MTFKQIKEEGKKFIYDILTDNSKYSQARLISLVGFICLSFFMWKLILIGGMQVDYFIAYAAYCTGTQTINIS